MFNMNVLEEKTDKHLVFSSIDKSNIIDVDDLDLTAQHVVIFDDSATEKDQKKLKIHF